MRLLQIPWVSRELQVLASAARMLVNNNSLRHVKAIRDKAEAARKYAQSAALGLKAQNDAAQIKLRAERRAGELLAGLIVQGGDRRSTLHDGSLKLADFGINYNQSSRWQLEASVPEEMFKRYVATANRLGQEITAQGLIQVARNLAGHDMDSRHAERNGKPARGKNGWSRVQTQQTARRREPASGCACADEQTDMSATEIVAELRNHRDLLAGILKPTRGRDHKELRAPERCMVDRLLADSGRLLDQLEQALASAR